MFVSCTSLQKVYENLSKIVAPTALFSLASAKVEQDFILTKDFRGKFKKKRFFGELEGARLTEWLLRVAKIAIKKGIWKERGGHSNMSQRSEWRRRRKGRKLLVSGIYLFIQNFLRKSVTVRVR